MKVGDLVQRKMIPDTGFYQIKRMLRNSLGGLRCEVICLTTGSRWVWRPSALKVLNESR